MNRTTLAIAALASLSLTAPAALADGIGAPLSACYDHVTVACDATSANAQACRASGMSACDAVVESPAHGQAGLMRIDFEDPLSLQPVIVFVHAAPATVPAAPAQDLLAAHDRAHPPGAQIGG
jgi:hypothetical protein